jgi:hypothetical protein
VCDSVSLKDLLPLSVHLIWRLIGRCELAFVLAIHELVLINQVLPSIIELSHLLVFADVIIGNDLNPAASILFDELFI